MSKSAVSKPYGFLDSDGVLIYPLNRFEDGDFPFAMPPFSVGFPEDIVSYKDVPPEKHHWVTILADPRST